MCKQYAVAKSTLLTHICNHQFLNLPITAKTRTITKLDNPRTRINKQKLNNISIRVLCLSVSVYNTICQVRVFSPAGDAQWRVADSSLNSLLLPMRHPSCFPPRKQIIKCMEPNNSSIPAVQQQNAHVARGIQLTNIAFVLAESVLHFLLHRESGTCMLIAGPSQQDANTVKFRVKTNIHADTFFTNANKLGCYICL